MTLRPIALLLAAELLLIAGVLGVGEAAARAALRLRILPAKEMSIITPLIVRPHPFIGFVLRENTLRQAGTPVEQRVGPHGFRGRPLGEKQANTLRVICLGDSTMYGESLAETDTIPAVLQNLLIERRPGRRSEVLNAGVVQYTSAETLAAMALRIIDLRPDVVVIYQGGNDIAPRLYRPFRGDYSQYRAVWEYDIHHRPDREFERSRLYVACRWLVGVFPAAQRIDWYTVRRAQDLTPAEKELTFVRSSESQFARNEAATVALARSCGARTLVVSPALNRSFESESSYAIRSMDQFRRTEAKTATEQGGIHLDLARVLENQQGAFRDSVHLTPSGARTVAGLLCEEILKRGW